MKQYKAGDQLGPFLLISNDGRKWTAKCKCGNEWETRLSRLKGRDNCPKCAPKRTFKKREPGEIINGNTLIKRLPSRKWEAKCKCGAIRVCSPCDLERYNSCANCYDRTNDKRFKLDEETKNLKYKLQYYKRHAKARELTWELSDNEVLTIINKNCYYCGIDFSNGIDRVENSIGYTVDNVVPCCSFCNHAKKNHSKQDFINAVKRIYEFQFNDYPEREYTQASGNTEPPSG